MTDDSYPQPYPGRKSLEKLVGTWNVSGPGKDIKSHWFDSEGDTFGYTYEVNDETLTIWDGEKGSPAYYQGKWSADGNTNSGGYQSTMTRVKNV